MPRKKIGTIKLKTEKEAAPAAPVSAQGRKPKKKGPVRRKG